VVVGILDPHVGGPGVARLREAGIEVEVGDGAEEVTALLRPYMKFRATGRPYVIAKFAVSLDGKVGAPSAGVRWLTSEAARVRAHQDRDWVDAILVGSGTVLADDPALTARPEGDVASRQPVRVVLDARGRTAPASRVFGEGGKTIVATTRDAPPGWRNAVAGAGATIFELEAGEMGVNLNQLLEALAQRNVMSLIAEGGPVVLASLFEGEHVDEVHAYVAPKILGEHGVALSLPGAGPLTLAETVVEPLPPDVLIRGYTGSWAQRLAL
jgi:diaminohydroxyphosphoribosylaminopyrimidine deaminase / 5-amino-6-(5-phosphoribosylamino)uracil reductase